MFTSVDTFVVKGEMIVPGVVTQQFEHLLLDFSFEDIKMDKLVISFFEKSMFLDTETIPKTPAVKFICICRCTQDMPALW